MRNRLKYLLVLAALLQCSLAFAQQTLRQRIDEERRGLSFEDPKALSKSKEFIRWDSTYYAGYYLEGAFKYFRAADAEGYDQAIRPLEKAMRLIEKDYKWQLRTRTSDLMTFFNAVQYQQDYGFMAYFLEQCYQNIERPDKAMEVLRRVRDKNMQMEFAVEPYNTMAWIYHRNRVYTSDRFGFLKNSVKENNAMAMLYLDSSAWKFRRDYYLNTRIFMPNYVEQQRFGIYHYKAILFAYDFQIDSAEYYYTQMQDWSGFSNNNYANFKHLCGDFKKAEQFYQMAAESEDYMEKRTREFNYMRGMIEVYKAQPERGDSMLTKVIELQGSTPGFGWHSIGLGRALHYQGLTAESQQRINKANAFSEMHIGTTWGPEQYDMTVALYNYLNKIHEKKEYLFENDGFWTWCNPRRWKELIRLAWQEYTLKLYIANLLANNPERAEVMYPLFSSENLMTFDEIWFLINDFSNDYFIDQYKKLLEKDKRPKVQKYFKYFIARLQLNKDMPDEAITYLNEVLADPELDEDYEKLLIARCYEALAEAYDQKDNEKESQKYALEMYKLYPQLLPYTGLQIPFRLKFTGEGTDEQFLAIKEEFEACDFDWTEDESAPLIEVEFKTNGKNREIHYRVSDAGNEALISDAMVIKKTEDTGKLLAYRIFNIKKKDIGAKVVVDPPKKREGKEGEKENKDSAQTKEPA